MINCLAISLHKNRKYFKLISKRLFCNTAKVTYILADGENVEVNGLIGHNFCEIALKNNIPIEAACDMSCSCSTCHV